MDGKKFEGSIIYIWKGNSNDLRNLVIQETIPFDGYVRPGRYDHGFSDHIYDQGSEGSNSPCPRIGHIKELFGELCSW